MSGRNFPEPQKYSPWTQTAGADISSASGSETRTGHLSAWRIDGFEPRDKLRPDKCHISGLKVRRVGGYTTPPSKILLGWLVFITG